MGEAAFGNTAIESIEIPKSMDSCGWFYGYGYTLDEVTYSLINGPFCLCENLKTITFEPGITQIASGLFGGAVGLEKIVIPDTVTIIENSAFYGCVRLKDATIGNAVTTIGTNAFYSCLSLAGIEIPDSVTEINGYAFSKCISLKNIEIPDNVTSMGTNTFEGCSSLESVKLPNTRQNITQYMFRNCTSLKTIELPETVTTIQSYAFQNCTALESVVFPEDSKLTEIQSYAFQSCTALESVVFPEDSKLTEIQSYAFNGCSSLKEAILPETTKTISNYAFKNCTSLEKVYIPQSTKNIYSQAFMGCELLSDVTIADYSITKIETDTFKDCPGIVSIVLPKGLTTIGSQAFMNCTGLTSVTIPESVTSIDSTAFSYPAKTTIYGKTGSYAETFATEGGFKFVDNTIAVEGLILKDGVENITLDRGETYRAEFEFYPEDANEVVTLTSSKNIVTINGMDIKANSTGDTVITATTTSGMTYEFNIHIRNANSISITNNPDKMSYIMGEELELTGMVVQVNYNDGSTREVTDYTVSGFDSSVEGTSTVTVKWVSPYGSTYSKTFTVDIVDPTPKVTGIYVGTMPNKTSYELREKLDITGLVIMANYTDGSTSEITGYTTSGFNALKTGRQTITVTYGDFTTTFNVTVGVVITLESIEIASNPTKTEYYIGDSLVTTGLALTLTYSDGSTETVTSGFTTSGFSSSAIGTKTVTVTYQGLTDTFNVTVKRPTITVSSTTTSLNVGNSTTLIATTTPSSQTVAWTSSNTSVATVSNGVVTAKGEGTATITAKFTYNGTTYSKTTTITVVAKVEHIASGWIIDEDATCTSYGSKHKECTICGEVLETESISPTGHSYSEWFVMEDPTCDAPGYEERCCLNADCDFHEERDISVLGHDYSTEYTVDKKPTYTSAGSKSKHCSRCDAKTDVTAIEKLYYGSKTYTGLYKVSGKWRYVKNGELNSTYTGLVKHTDGKYYYVKSGVKTSFNGLVKYNSKWYYVKDGVVNTSYTGLVKHTDGKYYYVKSGVKTSFNGLVKYNSKWYYVKDGVVNTNYTGLVKHTDGKYYYVKSGVKTSFNGLVKYNSKWYYVKSGVVNTSYTGLVKHTDGKWYYVKKGVKTSYTGTVTYNGKKYKVKNGVKV